ncbi:PAS-domain containing protein [Hydrogenophaga sp.]|uniref:PAS-domain containing protein n=1 Tax=Hydrogenophaga sp. TaxID=1904254 RepID=UPI003AF4F3D5
MTSTDPCSGGVDARRKDSLQAGLDLIDQGFTLIDENLRLVAWNQAFLNLLGFPPEMGQVGRPFESFMRYNAERGEYGDGDIEGYVRERVEAAKAFKTHDIERTRPNGTVLHIRGVPGPGHGFVTLYSDITRQRQSENLIREQNALLESRVAERTRELMSTNDQLREALRLKRQFGESLERSEAQMRLITDSIPALVAYFDATLVYRYINRGYHDWFGVDPNRPEQVSAREFLGIETYTRIKPFIKQALRGERVTFEYEAATLAGGRKLLRTTLIPELKEAGQVIGCFELTFDITQERKSHEMLVQAQKMEALGQLTSGLSHDFNNILTVVLGNLAALANQPDVKHHLDEFISPAIEAARRGSDLIKGLLAFSRQQPIESSEVDIDACVHKMDKLVRHTLPATLSLTFDLQATPAHCALDPHQLQNALLNLILNAKDATESRGHIIIRSEIQTLDSLHAQRLNLQPGPFTCVAVSDDGCGMDALTQSRVFEPFFTTKRVGQGSGLGMAMVYGFARQSGGNVEVSSEPGIGTTVRLWLPLIPSPSPVGLTPDTADAAVPPTEESQPSLALLVEDDVSVRKVVRRHLLELGYSVIEAENGQEALDILAKTCDLKLVLSDLVMPGGIDGQQVIRRASELEHIAKVVLMSGYSASAHPIKGVPLIQKPFTKEQLHEVLHSIRD